MNTTQALATVLNLMYCTRQENCLEGIELPDTITMSRKDFDLIGDTIAQCLINLKREENPELADLMQKMANHVAKSKTNEE